MQFSVDAQRCTDPIYRDTIQFPAAVVLVLQPGRLIKIKTY